MAEANSESKQEMYPQLKRSLENFVEEFRYLSLRCGPIHHEMFKAWQDQPTTKETWHAFEESVVDSEEHDDDYWEDWDGPEDGSFHGRFTGDESGMTEFTTLAESAFLTLCEFDPSLKKSDGVHGWIALLHDMGFMYPTSLLASEMSFWGLDKDPDLDDADHYGNEWVKSEGEVSYPKHPLCWHLVHNVFVSSIAALRILLAPEMALLVGHKLDALALPALPKKPRQDDGEKVAIAQSAESQDQPFRMERLKTGYHLIYQLGEIHEDEPFPEWRGFTFLYALYCQPSKPIPIGEMERTAGLIGKVSSAVPIGKMETHKGVPLAVTTRWADEAADSDAIVEARAKLEIVENLQKDAPDQSLYEVAEEEAVFLRKYINETARYPNSSDPEIQKISKTVDKAFKNMTDRIRNSIDRAREFVIKVMPHCGNYLYKTVDYDSQVWIYDPDRVTISADRRDPLDKPQT